MMKHKPHFIFVFLGLVAMAATAQALDPTALATAANVTRLAALPIPLLFVIGTME